MARSSSGRKVTPSVERTGAEPALVLVTTQGQAQSRLPWENQSTETFRARNATVSCLQPEVSEEHRGLKGLDGPTATSLRIGGRVKPGSTGELRVSIRLPPHTAPGRYEVSVQLDDRAVPVSIVVPEERQILLTPAVLGVEGRPGTVCEPTLVVENQGNVPVLLEAPVPTLLEAQGNLHAMLWRALQRTSSDRYEDLLSAFVAEAKRTTSPRLGRFIRVTMQDAPRQLEPGQTAVIKLRVKIPRVVTRGSAFRARVTIAGMPLRLNVLGTRGPDAPMKKPGRKAKSTV